MKQDICRIAIFYDGHYFTNLSNYYFHNDERKARIYIPGFHEFIVDEVAKAEAVDKRRCQIVDASYFRGRLTAQQAFERDRLYGDRVLEDMLLRADVTMYQRHLSMTADGGLEEKSIDVWLALEAYEMAALKHYDVCVLVTGDGDFVPLVRKLNTIGSRVMLLAWDLQYQHDGRTKYIRASQALIDRVNYPVMMSDIIGARDRKNDPLVNGIFAWPKAAESYEPPAAPLPPPAEDSANAAGEPPRVGGRVYHNFFLRVRKKDYSDQSGAENNETGKPADESAGESVPAASSVRQQGIVEKIYRKYDNGQTKRFGFIRPEGGNGEREDNYYFHEGMVEGGDFDALEENQAVEFEPVSDYQGRKIARHVHGRAAAVTTAADAPTAPAAAPVPALLAS
ncbi:MAG: NYN domain-containing protein [Burkholderiaceae bacterium]|jgi:uncharacterized LabA/DUF88 family protein/cold shock CspA family protein|nr:NYN domain-containing protein [Burkholderiaceae bacterium]